VSKYPTQIPSKDKYKVPFDYESYEERGDEEGDGELVGEGDAEAEDDDKRNEGPGNSSRIEREIKGILVKKCVTQDGEGIQQVPTTGWNYDSIYIEY